MEDNDVVHLCKGAYGIFNVGHPDRSLAVPRVLQTLEMEVNHIMKGGYDHFMQKEIHEQPESVTETMRGRVKFVKSPERVRVSCQTQCIIVKLPLVALYSVKAPTAAVGMLTCAGTYATLLQVKIVECIWAHQMHGNHMELSHTCLCYTLSKLWISCA